MTKYLETKKNSLEDDVLRMKEKLVGGQKKLDKDKDGDIDGKDFAILRKQAKNKKEKSEAAKPDFLDLDKDGNKKEPMKVAAKQAKAKKEETELDEKFTKKDFAKNEADNEHTKNGVELVKMFGTPEEKRIMTKIAKSHKERG